MVRLALVLLAVLAGCRVDPRSDEYRCELPADCVGGQTCVGGWCVLASDGGDADGSVDAASLDALVCPPACDECTGGRCILRCDLDSSCPTELVCPAGIPCTVECSGPGSCGGGVDCSMASDCDVECTGTNSCAGATTCGTGPCLVRCTAATTCGGNVDCAAACRCDVECTGAGACPGTVDCAGPGACEVATGCTSAPNPCNNC